MAVTVNRNCYPAVGDCLLEWDEHGEGRPAPLPMLKDMFANERRKAKVGLPSVTNVCMSIRHPYRLFMLASSHQPTNDTRALSDLLYTLCADLIRIGAAAARYSTSASRTARPRTASRATGRRTWMRRRRRSTGGTPTAQRCAATATGCTPRLLPAGACVMRTKCVRLHMC